MVDIISLCGECFEGIVCGVNLDKFIICEGDDCGDVIFEGYCEDVMVIFC